MEATVTALVPPRIETIYSGVRKTAKLAFFPLNFFNVRSSLAGFLSKLTGQVMTHSLQEKSMKTKEIFNTVGLSAI